MKNISLVAFSSLIGLTSSVHGQILQNGSFELPTYSSPPYYRYVPSEASIPSWALTGTGLGEQTYLMDFVTPGTPYLQIPGASGNRALRLSYGDTIGQSITDLAIGTSYRVSMATMGSSKGFGPLRVTVGEITNDFTTEGLQFVVFTATSSTASLLISAVPTTPQVDSSVAGIYIDSITVVPYSQAPASLALAFYPGLAISGDIGGAYRIEFASELAPTNWLALTNIILPSSPYFFFDTSAGTASKRFYRVVNP